jgi:SAM-dependent methyltransferase
VNEPLDDQARRILQFYRECLQPSAPVANVDLIRDSQTRGVLEEIFKGNSPVDILDYGCGELRLLNALLSNHSAQRWTYHGADIEDPSSKYAALVDRLRAVENLQERWTVGTLADASRMHERFDAVVLMNVVHELPIVDLASIIENLRHVLRPNGHLLLVDTVYLPEGEPRFVPFYPWEIEVLFPDGMDRSYVSRSGVPIIFYTVPQSGLPCFHFLPEHLDNLVSQKRDIWSHLAIHLAQRDFTKERKLLGLGSSKEFDYAYLNTIIANANYRLMEHKSATIIETHHVDRCAVDLIKHVDLVYTHTRSVPSVADIYKALGARHENIVLKTTLSVLENIGSLGAICPIMKTDKPIRPMEIWDMLVDHVGEEWILDKGLRAALAEAISTHTSYTS